MSGSVLDRLGREAPWLAEALAQRTRLIVPPRFTDRWADRLELAEARAFLVGLRRDGRRDLDILLPEAAAGRLVDKLLDHGDLDGFRLRGVWTDDPGLLAAGEYPALDRGDLPVRPLAGYAPRPDRARLEPGREPLAGCATARRRKIFSGSDRDRLAGLFDNLEARARARVEPVFTAGKTVLFAGIYAYFNASRYSLALRRRGWTTVSLCLNPSNTRFKDGHFDAVVDAGGDLELFYRLFGAWPFACVHYQAWLGLHAFAAAAARLTPGRFVVELNDLPSFVLEPEAFDAVFGPRLFDLEMRSLGDVLAHSDAAVFNLSEEGVEAITAETGTRCPAISFHSYPLPDFFARPVTPAANTPARIAFAGSLNASSQPHSVFGDVKLFGLCRELLAQDLEFHLYLNPYQDASPQGPFWDYFHLAKRRPGLHVHAGVEPGALIPQLSRLDWGSLLYRFPEDFEIKPAHMGRMAPTKFFTYLEAGLPVLVSREIRTLADWVERHGLGLVLGQEDIPRLADILRQTDRQALVANVLRWREAQSMDRHIASLEALLTGPDTPGRADGRS